MMRSYSESAALAARTELQPRRIIVPTDFSEVSLQALERALTLAVIYEAQVRVIHVVVGGQLSADGVKKRSRVFQARVDTFNDSRPASAKRVELVFEDAPKARVATVIRAVVARHHADLVVIGTRGGGLLSDSWAEEFAAHANTNVLVVRRDTGGDWPAGPPTVLVGIDFSANAQAALAYARALTPACGRVIGLHTVPRDAATEPALSEEQRRDAELRLLDWGCHQLDEVIVAKGDPATTIVRVCEESSAGLIVLGQHRQRGLFGPVGVANRVIRSAPCPTLAVAPGDRGS